MAWAAGGAAEPLRTGPGATLADLEAAYGPCAGMVLGYGEGEFGPDGRLRWCAALLPGDAMVRFVNRRRAGGDRRPFLVAMGSLKRAEARGGVGNALYGFGLAASAVLPAADLLHADQLVAPENLNDDGVFRWPNGVPFLRVWLCHPPRRFEDLTGQPVVFGQQHGSRVVPLAELPGDVHGAARGVALREAAPDRPRPLPEGLDPLPRFREGALRVRLRGERERDPEAKRLALRANRARFGAYTCEGCGYRPGEDARVPRNRASSMLDVHHVEPLAGGARDTTLDGLAVLCPLCHRRHHVAEATAVAESPDKRRQN